MNEEIKNITVQLKEILNKYPNRQLEILLYVFGRDNLMDMINEPTYEELQQENQQLKEKLELYENGVIYDSRVDKLERVLDEIREYINGAYEMACYTKSISLEQENIEDLLQILDKVKE